MNVVITLAGHSRRFREAGYDVPKFLISVAGQSMIEHVLDMFSETDVFHFVLNRNQEKENPGICELLNNIRPLCHLTIIEPHEYGPAHSATQVETINDNEPVLISYCDFTVEWHYEKFIRSVTGYAGAIPAFSGFQPASFGSTKFAYMLIDENDELIELREKESFTDERHKEPASVGIYYFDRWQTFLNYARELQEVGFGGLAEGYVSLLFNLMIADGLKIKVTQVEKFICLGTPEDVNLMDYWFEYFNSELTSDVDTATDIPKKSNRISSCNMVPIAGRGSRFKQEQYNTRKPFINIGTTPMLALAAKSLPSADEWILLPLLEDAGKYPILNLMEGAVDGAVKILPVESLTQGQAITCLLGMEAVSGDPNLLISSCDYKVVFNQSSWEQAMKDHSIDAFVWCLNANIELFKDPNAFAYCVENKTTGNIERIVEKQTISNDPSKDPLAIGIFWFRRASDFERIARKAIEKNVTINGEYYVANAMNLLIEEGKRLSVFYVDKWISLGDPFELKMYEFWDDYFWKKARI